jgi:hypothetical protein
MMEMNTTYCQSLQACALRLRTVLRRMPSRNAKALAERVLLTMLPNSLATSSSTM